ncbi:hypothetical protein ACFW04_006351 [Cataglyphis niger]
MVGTRVYVGGLPYGTRERDLERFFRGYGRFRDVLIKNGYGFVEFDDYRDADDAVYELNGKELLGERITVERARGTPRGSDQWRYGDSRGGYGDSRRSAYGPPTRTEYRLTVENLSSRVSWQVSGIHVSRFLGIFLSHLYVYYFTTRDSNEDVLHRFIWVFRIYISLRISKFYRVFFAGYLCQIPRVYLQHFQFSFVSHFTFIYSFEKKRALFWN